MMMMMMMMMMLMLMLMMTKWWQRWYHPWLWWWWWWWWWTFGFSPSWISPQENFEHVNRRKPFTCFRTLIQSEVQHGIFSTRWLGFCPFVLYVCFSCEIGAFNHQHLGKKNVVDENHSPERWCIQSSANLDCLMHLGHDGSRWKLRLPHVFLTVCHGKLACFMGKNNFSFSWVHLPKCWVSVASCWIAGGEGVNI